MKINKHQENILIFLIAEYLGINDRKELVNAIPKIREKIVKPWLAEITKQN